MNEPSGHTVSNEAVTLRTNMYISLFMKYVKVVKLIVNESQMAFKKERGRDTWVVS